MCARVCACVCACACVCVCMCACVCACSYLCEHMEFDCFLCSDYISTNAQPLPTSNLIPKMIQDTDCRRQNGVHSLEISLQVSYFPPSLTSEHKGAHAGYEPGEEGVEGEGAHKTAVEKLYNARQHHIGQICVHQLQPLGRTRLVLFQEALYHRNQSLRAHFCSVLPVIVPLPKACARVSVN